MFPIVGIEPPGKWKKNKTTFLKKQIKLLKANDIKYCCTFCRVYKKETIINTTPLYIDVDDEKADVDKIMRKTDKILKKYYGKNNVTHWVLKQTKNKYHIWYPDIHVSKSTLGSIYDLLSGIDKNSNNIPRFEGFTKWSDKDECWVEGSEYKRVDGKEIDIDFYNEIYNFNQEETKLIKQFKKVEKIKKNVKIIRNSEMVASTDFSHFMDETYQVERTYNLDKCIAYHVKDNSPRSSDHGSNDKKVVYYNPDEDTAVEGYMSKEWKKNNSFKQVYGGTQLNSNGECLIPFSDEKEEINFNLNNCCDTTLAIIFTKLFGDRFIYTNKQFYFYNKKYWVLDKENKKISTTISDDFYFKLDEHVSNRMRGGATKELIELKKNILCVLGVMKIKNIIECLKFRLWKEIEFDTDPYVIVFKNGIYDLKEFEFRMSRKDEYISNSLTTGYDYEEVDSNKMDFINEYMYKTFPDEQERKIYFTYLCTILLGLAPKNFCINNGCGDNNKSGLMDFCGEMMGEYYESLSAQILIDKKPDAASLYKLNKKRFVCSEEPRPDCTINGSLLKQMTGNKKGSWRQLYGTDTNVILHLTLFICCNAKPPILPVDTAIKNRILDYIYKSIFGEEEDEKNNKFKCDKYFISDEFYNEYKMTLFHFLLPHLKVFYEQGQIIRLNDSLKQRRDQYLIECDDFYMWFRSTYDFVDDKTKYKTIKDIFWNYKQGDFYQNQNKPEKRKINPTSFKDKLLYRGDIAKRYVERYQRYIDGKQKETKNVILGIVCKSENDDDE